MKSRIFITGISTEVGKTITAAIITEALQADYWKPVQAGDLDHSDSDKVRDLVSNDKTVIHPNSYALETPMSPHAAAELESMTLQVEKIQEPDTDNTLVIEGAGGLWVPLNNQHTILDLIKPSYNVVVVSRHYLGSINHSLLTIKALQQRGLQVGGIVFSGNEHPSTESVILAMSGVPRIGRIEEEASFTPLVISKYASRFQKRLRAL